MENERKRLVVILAGYEVRRDDFFRLNPGMASRVAHQVKFPDYDVNELSQLGRGMLDSVRACRPAAVDHRAAEDRGGRCGRGRARPGRIVTCLDR